MTILNLTVGTDSPNLELEQLIGSRTAVLGESGSGKSNTVATLAEEIAPHIPMSIIDPEGEMFTLRSRIDAIIVGRSENVDLEIAPHQAAEVARYSVEHRISVILDLSEAEEGYEAYADAYAKALFDACKSAKPRLPYHVIIEEAHLFMPQPSPMTSPYKQIALRGRKYGLGVVIASQRSQMVDKDFLTQAAIKVLHQVSHPRDVGVYKDLINLPAKAVEDTLNRIQTGQAITVYRNERGLQTRTVSIRRRHTPHAGATPTLEGVAGDTISPPSAHLRPHIEALRAILQATATPRVSPEVARLTEQVRTLQEQLALSDSLCKDLIAQNERATAEIVRLRDRIETLRLIQVQVSIADLALATGTDGGSIAYSSAVSPRQKPAVYQQPMFRVEHPNEELVSLNVKHQREELGRLIKNLRTLPKQDAQMLRCLIEQVGSSMSIEDLAVRLSYASQTLRSKPPKQLIGMGLIARNPSHGRLVGYRATPAQRFPDLPLDEVVSGILSALPH